jgi:hypothetical protein
MKARGIFAVMAATVLGIVSNGKLAFAKRADLKRKGRADSMSHHGGGKKGQPGCFGRKNAGVKLARRWGR